MKTSNKIIYPLLTLAASMMADSCSDDTFNIYNKPHESSSDLIRFDVSSGFVITDKDSRGLSDESDVNNDDEGLCPMILAEGKDTLYLHRYVSPESKRATGHGSAVQARSNPITTVVDFKALYGDEGFMVYAMNAEDDSEFFPLTVAKPLSTDASGEIWYMPDQLPQYRFWPEEQPLRFNAYAPKNAGPSLTNLNLKSETITFDYTVPVFTDAEGNRRDGEKQPDLVFASSVFTHHKNSEGHSDCAPLNFRHALSAIKFAVRDITKWTIVDISIKGIAGSGSCVFTPDADNESEQVFLWNPDDNFQTFTQTFDYMTTDPYEPDSPDNNIPSQVDAPVINDKVPEKTFMFIPQEIPEDAEIEIKLKFGDNIKVLIGKLKTNDIPLWEPGKEYVYTLSTSSVNWTYVFNVVGSLQGERTYDYATSKYKYGSFEDNSSKIEIEATVTEGSYYKVQSYRYRTNSPDKTEILPWTAEASSGVNDLPEDFEKYRDNIPNMTLSRENWLLGDNWVYADNGSTELKEFRNLSFARQYSATDYDGDWMMRVKQENGSKSQPIDLSMVYGRRNTANCYLVNAGGWYSIPLYYGSSIKNNDTIPESFTSIENQFIYSGGETATYYSLSKYLDYKGKEIEHPDIKTPVKDAIVAWQDAYGIIDSCKYDSSTNQLVFHIDPTYLQQANCVVAIRDNEEKIIWSWHIWVNDIWVNDNLTIDADKDVECEAWDTSRGNFKIAPINLGWCNPKNVLVLKRSGTMTFTQTDVEKEKVLATKKLDVIQRPDQTEYWIGNNTYYQFGRKDPMVGFVNDESLVKSNYGDLEYVIDIEGEGIDINKGIQNPNTLFIGPRDWLKISYYNLWNNYNSPNLLAGGTITSILPGNITIPSANPNLTTDFAYSAIKTIYDPSPVGYVVPPVELFKTFTDGIGNPNTSDLQRYVDPSYFKGIMDPIEGHTNLYNYYAYPNKSHTGDKLVFFNVTGQRSFLSGENWGPNIVYLWSNTAGFYTKGLAYSFAMGYDTDGSYWLNAYFQGTKTMARPVRCVKEF